jgi:hypothetical protein
MKKILTVSLILVSFYSEAQTIHTVNNNPGAPTGVNVYANFTDAQTAAVDGDIIYIIPSGINYGTINIEKELTVYGVGLYPDTQTNLRSTVSNVVFNSSNARVSGLVITYLTNEGNSVRIAQDVINIVIDNSSFKKVHANQTGIANILIQNCVITEKSNHAADGLVRFHTTSTNVKLTNNIIYANSHVTQAYGVLYGLNGAVIENNLFMGHISGARPRVFGSITNCLIKNNIFYGASPNPRQTFTGNTVDYNMTYGSTVNTFTATDNTIGPNNQIGIDPMFTNVVNDLDWSIDYDYSLLPGSTAIGAGDDLTDLGIAGGATPFDPTATSLPVINSIDIPSIISQGSQLPVTIKGRGN